MPITIVCDCGKSSTVDESLVGKKIKCPACKTVMVVPTSKSQVISESLRTDAVEEARNDPDPPAGFFMAVDAALLGSNSLYRVYPDGDALVFLRVGSFFGPLGVELGRKGRGGHWLGSAADAAKPVISGAVLVVSIILVIMFRLVIRSGGENLRGVLDVLAVFGLIGLFFGLLALWIIRGTLQRAAVLDAMSAEQRRAEVARDRRNRVLTADDIAAASLDKAAGGWGSDEVVPANLTLTLRPKGKQKLRLQHRPDVKAAVRAVKRLIGRQNVVVNVPLKGQE